MARTGCTPDSCEIDTWFICIISHYSQGSTLNFYPTCQFRQEIMIFSNFNFNCLIFYQNYFDKTFLPNSVINFSSIAFFFFYDLKTSLNKKLLVQLDKRPSILTCPNFIFTGSRQVLMMSPDSVLSTQPKMKSPGRFCILNDMKRKNLRGLSRASEWRKDDKISHYKSP